MVVSDLQKGPSLRFPFRTATFYLDYTYTSCVTTSVLIRVHNTHARTYIRVARTTMYIRVISSHRALQSRLSLDKKLGNKYKNH